MSDVATPDRKVESPKAVEPPAAAATRKPRRRWARGVDRPEYLRPGDIDRVMVMLVALMAEVSTLRERLDTHEALAALGQVATHEAVEGYDLTPERCTAREAERHALLKRVLRAITEEREAALEGSRRDGAAPEDHAEGDDDDHPHQGA